MHIVNISSDNWLPNVLNILTIVHVWLSYEKYESIEIDVNFTVLCCQYSKQQRQFNFCTHIAYHKVFSIRLNTFWSIFGAGLRVVWNWKAVDPTH